MLILTLDKTMNNLMLLKIAERRAKVSNTYLKINTKENKLISKKLEGLKIPFVLVGGWAVNNYMPARQTKDIDILVSRSQQQEVFKELKGIHLGSLSIGGDSFLINDQEIDVLYCDSEWDHIYETSIIANNIRIISLGHLIIMKLDASRLQDLADCSRMLGYANNDSIKEVTKLIKKLRPSYLEDYYSLIKLGKLEIKI